MIVRVRLFAALRERAGTDRLELDLPEGAVVADALAAVDGLAAGLPLVLAVNREYAARDRVLRADDELAVVPPVSGGAAAPGIHTAVVDHPLSLDALVVRVADPRAGAIVTFAGVTRDVAHLDYEGYVEMAEAELARIVAEAVAAHGLCAAAAEHRTGRVATGEASILVAASAPHRPEAFAGARAIIDAVKERLPVWKQEEGSWKHEHLPLVAAPAPVVAPGAPAVRELRAEEFGRAAAVLLELRPRHASPDRLAAAARAQADSGYRLLVAEQDGEVVAAAGFRLEERLAFGRLLYVDDLVTAERHRGRGAATALLRRLDAIALAERCAELHLDSGVGPDRRAAHRRYFSHGMRIAAHHFSKELAGD